MTRWRAAGLLAVVVVGHAAYYAWPAGAQRRWAFYVLGGLAFALAMLLHMPSRQAVRTTEAGAVAAAACWWGVLEGVQQAACGAIGWRHSPADRDLCVALFGHWPYALAAAMLLAGLIVKKLQARNP